MKKMVSEWPPIGRLYRTMSVLLLAAMVALPALAEDATNSEAASPAAAEAAQTDEAMKATEAEAANKTSETATNGTSETAANGTSETAQSAKAQDSGAELYLTIEDQKAILDKKADEVMMANVIAEHKADEDKDNNYVVRIEVYARSKESYIPFGDVSLSDGFFVWMHDGYKKNGYAVFMYSTKSNKTLLEVPDGAYLLYGKSFRSASEAVAEVTGEKTKFRRLIAYKPVVKQMENILKSAAYEGGK